MFKCNLPHKSLFVRVINYFPHLKQSTKIRQVDSAVHANKCILQKRSVALPTPLQLLHAIDATIKGDGWSPDEAFLDFTRAAVRRANRVVEEFEGQWLDLVKGKREKLSAKFFVGGVVNDFIDVCEGLFVSGRVEPCAKRLKRAQVKRRPVTILVADLWKMYSNFPVKTADMPYNGVIMWDDERKNKDGKLNPGWEVFEAETALFGNAGSVFGALRHTEFISDCISSSHSIPTLGYVDDFTLPIPDEIFPAGKEAALGWLSSIGYKFKSEDRPDTKIKFGKIQKVIGVTDDVSNHNDPWMFIDSESREKTRKLLQSHVDSNILTPSDAKVVMGQSGHNLVTIVGRKYSPLLRPFSIRAEATSGDHSLSPILRYCCLSLKEILELTLEKRPVWENSLSKVYMYTDASWQNKTLSGECCVVVIFQEDGVDGRWRAILARAAVPGEKVQEDSRAWAVNLLETVTPIWGISVFEEICRGKFLALSVDNNTAKSSLLNIHSLWKPAYVLCSHLWAVETGKKNIVSWISRIKSRANLSDIGTHFRKLSIFLSIFPGFFSEVWIDPQVDYLFKLSSCDHDLFPILSDCCKGEFASGVEEELFGSKYLFREE